MKNILLPTLFSFISLIGHAQIIDESTAQAVTWFDLGESRTYEYVTDKYRIDGADTLQRQTMTRDVTMNVVDSTEVSYTIELRFSNYRTGNREADLLSNEMMGGIKVVYRTDELGTFEEIVNGEEIMQHMGNISLLFEDLDGFKAMSSLFSNEFVILGSMLKYALQFHYFHGASMTLGERNDSEYEQQLDNGSVINRDISFWLDEVCVDDGWYVFSSVDRISPDSIKGFVVDMSASLLPDFKGEIEDTFNSIESEIENETTTTTTLDSRGWIEHSTQRMILGFGSLGSVEERVIKAK